MEDQDQVLDLVLKEEMEDQALAQAILVQAAQARAQAQDRSLNLRVVLEDLEEKNQVLGLGLVLKEGLVDKGQVPALDQAHVQKEGLKEKDQGQVQARVIQVQAAQVLDLGVALDQDPALEADLEDKARDQAQTSQAQVQAVPALGPVPKKDLERRGQDLERRAQDLAQAQAQALEVALKEEMEDKARVQALEMKEDLVVQDLEERVQGQGQETRE